MTLSAAIGQAKVREDREAGMQAVYEALNQMGTVTPSLGIVLIPDRYEPQQIIQGATSLLPNIPIIGMSVSAGFSQQGLHTQCVIAALIGGDSLQAETHWFPNYSQASDEIAAQIVQLISYERKPVDQVLIFSDGLNANTEQFCKSLPEGLPLTGGLASGDLLSMKSYQFTGMHSGSGGLAAAFLRGNFKIGSGYGHGWFPVGAPFQITRSRGFWLRTLDNQPAAEIYAQFLGQSSAAWVTPPLNTMSRTYPLGLEQDGSSQLQIRAPLRLEADGSLRMNAVLHEEQMAYIMAGAAESCETAAREAAQQALTQLGDAKPVFALVLVDIAWQMLLQAQPGREIQAIRQVLGASLPIVGGYTLGQILPPGNPGMRSQFLNQHILIILYGEEKKI